MASLREIKGRITATEKMSQLTSAMNMVANSKYARSEQNTKKFRPYMDRMQETVQAIASSGAGNLHPMLQERPVKRVGYLLITSDTGKAGPYNANVMKAITTQIHERHKGNQDEVSLLVLGKIGYDILKTRNYKIDDFRIGLPDQPSFSDVKKIAHASIRGFEREEIDELYIIYNEFVSILEQNVKVRKLLPMSESDLETQSEFSSLATYEFEPDNESILETLLPQYAEAIIYGALLEAKTSEHAARMTAMKAATDNANELIGDLTLSYNRLRQAAITQEITEIVSGAQAQQ